MTTSAPLSGFLVIDKPEGITSFGVVARVRRRAGGARTGHAGTLDPLATGVLVLAIGAATRSIDRVMATEKRYRTEVDLTAFTTTDDREGERREIAVSEPPSADRVRATLRQFVGAIQQRPPQFSAMKVGGRRAYKLARAGAAPEMAPRVVEVYEINLLRYEWPIVELDIRCGKGTYIRSIARDLGAALGTGGHCRTLRRTAVGRFDESRAIALDALPEALRQSDLLTIEEAMALTSG